MLLTQKIRIWPSLEQEQVLWDLSEKCRLLYNFALQERKQDWIAKKNLERKERHYLTYQQQSKILPIIKQKYPEYRWVYSKVLQQVLKKLDENFKSFFIQIEKGEKNAHPPRFKGKKYFFTLCYNQSGFKIDKRVLYFSHKHPSNINLNFIIPSFYEGFDKIKQVEIKQEKDNKWFICIVFELEAPTYKDNGLYQAIDLGVINLVSAVNLSFKFIQVKNSRSDLYWNNIMKEIQSKRDHCKRGSHRWIFYNRKLLKIKKKCKNQMQDYQHKISNKIIKNTRANTIIIGDLDVKKMVKKQNEIGNRQNNKARKTLNHSIQNTGSLGRFSQFLTYKAKKIGKRVIRIDESYTSQQCCICGKRTKRALSERVIKCDCGNHMDRDLNSAVNILERFLKQKHQFDFLSQQPSMAEESFLKRLDLLRNTAPSLEIIGDGGLVVSE
ncbi:MAG: RNA-guided endonuclease InsQ/TnpB family protein [Promethearchaeota archaeon]